MSSGKYTVENLGCWSDSGQGRAISTLEGDDKVLSLLDGDYRKRIDAYGKCLRAALHLGIESSDITSLINKSIFSLPESSSIKLGFSKFQSTRISIGQTKVLSKYIPKERENERS